MNWPTLQWTQMLRLIESLFSYKFHLSAFLLCFAVSLRNMMMWYTHKVLTNFMVVAAQQNGSDQLRNELVVKLL